LSGLTTGENGTTTSFSVVLTSEPTADVNIALSSADPSEGTVAQTSLAFNDVNWVIPQTVFIAGVDDLVDDGDIAYTIITDAATSDDGSYNGLDAEDVSVTNLDDDSTPVAAKDTYITNEDILTISAPGVLGNDTDANGQDTISALLDQDANNGSVSLNLDGSFVYTPELNFTGEDNFSYWATDGTNLSPSTLVTITVDRVAPIVEWVSPVENDEQINVKCEMIQLAAIANDNFEIGWVRFYRWDAINLEFVEIGNVYSPPFSVELDTCTLNLGFNQAFVRAYDTAGNRSIRESIWIYRDNYYLWMPMINR
jgi:hypothetical protein